MNFPKKTEEELLHELMELQEQIKLLKTANSDENQIKSKLQLSALNKINSIMVKKVSIQEVVSSICQILVEDAKFQMAWIGWVNDETKQVEPIAIYGDNFDYVKQLKVYIDDSIIEGKGLIGLSIKENRPVVVNDAMKDERIKFWHKARQKTNLHSSISIPFAFENEVKAALVVYSNQKNYFGDSEIDMLEAVAKSFQNFNKRLKFKEELHENENRYKYLVENLEAGIVVHAPNTQIIKFNNKSTELLGLTSEQMEGKLAIDSAWMFLNEDGSAMHYENYPVNLVLKNLEPIHNYILGIQQPNRADIVWVSVNGTQIFNEQNELKEILISFFDITEKVNAEKKLRLQDKYLSEIQRLTRIGNYETFFEDSSWKCSDVVYEILGIDKNFPKSLGSWLAIIHPDHFDKVYKDFNKYLSQQKLTFPLEYKIIRQTDKQIRWLSAVSEVNYDSNGKPSYLTGTVQDITERKLIELALKESQERYEFVNKATQDAIYDWNILTNEVFRNESYQELFSPNEPVGKDSKWWEKQIHPEDLERINNRLYTAFEKQEKSLTEEYRFKKQDGTYAYVIDRGHIIYNEDGKPIRMIGAMNDVTEQRNAENQLKINKNRLETIIASEPECVKIVDSRGNLLEMNPSGLAMLEAETLEDVKKKTLVGFLTPSYRQSFMDLHKKVMSGESGILEFEIIGLNGTKRWLETHATPLKDGESNEILLLGVTRDVTSRKFAEDALKSLSTTFSAISGEEFFYKVSKHLTETLGIACAFIGKLDNVKSEVIVIGGYNNGENLQDIKYEIINTPCSNVLETGICTYPQNAQKLFPKDEMLFEMGFDSYSGCPIRDKNGNTIGIMVLLDSKPLQNIEQLETVFSIYSERVSAELERMRAEEDLIISERRLSNIIEGTGVGTWEWNVKTSETVFDNRWVEMLGYSPEELQPNTLETWTNLVYPDDLKIAFEKVENHFNGKTDSYACDLRMLHKSGDWVWILDQGKVIEWDTDGKPLLMYGTHTDITERKEIEEKLKFTQFSIENASDAILWITKDAKIIDINEAAVKSLGYSKEEYLTFSVHDIDPNYNAEIWPSHFEELKQKGNLVFETLQKSKDGRIIPVEVTANYIKFNDEEFNCAFVRDISERKANERKILDQTQFTQTVTNGVPSMIGYWTKDLICTFANNTYLEWFGYKPEDMIGIQMQELLGEELFKMNYKYISGALSGEKQKFERKLRKPSGEEGYTIAEYIPDFQNELVVGFIVLITDINEIKKAQSSLNEAQRIAHIGSWQWDIVPNIVTWSDEQYRIFGENKDFFEANYDGYLSHLSEKDKVKVNKLVESALSGAIVYETENEIIKSDGSKAILFEQGKVEFDSDGKPIRMYGTSQDITDRKRIENRILEQSKFIETVTNSIPSLVGYWNSDIKLTFANEAYNDLFGRKPSEIIGKTMIEVLGEKVFKEIESKVQAALTGEEQTFERTIINKNNEVIYALVQYIPDVYNNEVKGFVALTTDITEIKKTQINLNEAQRISKIGSWQFNLITNEVEWSDELYKIYGRDKETFVPSYETYLSHLTPDEQERTKAIVFDAINGKKEYLLEHEITKPDGTKSIVQEQGKLGFDTEGKPVRMYGTTQDVTERVKKDAETKFQAALLNSVGQAVIATDAEGFITYLNKSAQDVYGWKEEEALAKNILNVTVPDISLEESLTIMNKLIKGESWLGEFNVRNKNGDIFPAIVHNSPIIDTKGELIGIIGISTDISERKEKEQHLKLLESVIINANDSVLITEAEPFDEPGPRILFVNNAFTKMTGYTAEEVIGKTPRILQGTKTDKNELKKLSTALRNWEQCEATLVNYKKTGEEFWIHISINPVANEDGWFTHWIAIERDVTLQKMAQEELKLSELRYRELVKNLEVGVVLQDYNSKILLNNDKALELLGLTENQLIGKNSFDPEWNIVKENGELFKGEEHPSNLSLSTKKPVHNVVMGVYNPLLRERKWLMVHANPIVNELGQAIQTIVTFEDITNRRYAEIALKESEQQLRLAIRSGDLGLWDWNASTGVLSVNDRWLEMLGLNRENITPSIEYWHSLVHPEDMPKLTNIIAETINNPEGTSIEVEIRAKHSNGNYIWILDMGNIVARAEDGSPLRIVGTHMDITERKNIEQALIDSERFLRETQKVAGQGSYNLDLTTFTWESSEVLNRIFGIDDKFNRTTESWVSMLHPDWAEEMNDYFINEVIGKKQKFEKEYKIIRQNDKSEVWVYGVGELNFDEKGIPVTMYGTIQDITDRKLAELAVQENEAKLRLIFDTLGEGVALNEIIFNENGEMIDYRILEVNQAYFSVAQYDKNKKVIGALATELYKMDLKTISEFWHYHKNQNETIYTEFQGPEDGRYYGIYTSPIFNHKFVTSFLDITERRMNELALRESEEKFRNIINLSPVPYALNDDNQNVKYLNEAFIKTFGYSLDEIPTLSDWWPKAYPDPVYREMVSQVWLERLQVAIENSLPFEPMEVNICCKDGTYKTVIGEAGALSSNYLGTHLVILYDITERKETEMELLSAKERAEESDRLKSAFLANMSHEIRTPMNGILGFTSLLKEDEITKEEQREYVSIIEKSGARLLNIINDIIDISKIESGQIKVHIAKTNVKEQLNYILDFFKLEAESKGIKLISNINLKDEESIIETDREKIYAALINLTKNAVKFTSKGSIEIGCNIKSNMLEFYVKDTGYGIPKDKLNLIFERFRQVSESLSRNYEGAGLGLSITKAYIEMLGGNIWAESNLGKGSTFYFTIPYTNNTKVKKANRSDMNNNDTTKSKKIKVLIAEDNEESEKFLTIAMKKYSSEILIAHNGNEAVEIAKANPNIDLILMDVQMPTLSGYEATKQIKSFNSNVIIIAQTAHGFDSDRKEALKIGCDDYISKPIDLATLKAMMKKHFNLK